MKQMTRLIVFSLTSLVVLVGCLKDKGFDDQEYGTQIKEVKGVAFTQAASSPVSYAVTASSSSLTIDGPAITLEQEGNATTDVQVTLQINNALVTAQPGLTPLPASAYTLAGGLTVTIPAGQKFALVKLVFPNSASLNSSLTYGLGLTIASVTPGYTIASNQKDIVLEFSVKNKYDGVYRLFGVHNRPTLDGPYRNILVHLITTGPDKVKMYWPALGADAHPINGGATYYSTFTTEFRFAVSSAMMNPLIAVDNPYTPGSPPFTVGPSVNSRWSDTTINNTPTKIIYAEYYYNNRPADRRFTDTLIYQGPR